MYGRFRLGLYVLVGVLAAGFLVGHVFHASALEPRHGDQLPAASLACETGTSLSAPAGAHHHDWADGHHRRHGLSCLAMPSGSPAGALVSRTTDASFPLPTAPAVALRLPEATGISGPPLFLLHASLLI